MRLAVAGQAVVGDKLATRIARDDTAGLAPEHRAALRYADAHMMDPRGIGPELRTELHHDLTTEQIVELSLDVSAWNRQKVMVALETDLPVNEHRLSALTFDVAGYSQFSDAF